jgi:hypothetical protein
MEQSALQGLIRNAERRLADLERRIEGQRAIVRASSYNGAQTILAEMLLDEFQKARHRSVLERDRLLGEQELLTADRTVRPSAGIP